MKLEQDITRMSATQLAQIIREKRVKVVDVIDTFLEKIERVNPMINAFITIMRTEAKNEAILADRLIMEGKPLGPLHGVPIAIKDLTPVKGVRFTQGSRLHEHDIADSDAEIIKRIRAAGAIIIGKTNTPEFGHKGTTTSLIFGTAFNPWDITKHAGGSSGGSAAAVAAHLVPFAEGSDGGGSIRLPSAFCGVVGFKASYGRIPQDNTKMAFESTTPFIHYGPIARTVEDAAVLYDVMSGPFDYDPYTGDAGLETKGRLERDIENLKIAYSPSFDYFEVDKEIEQACDQAAENFKKLGAIIEKVQFDFKNPKENIESAWFNLWCGLLATSCQNLSKKEFSLLEPKVQEWSKKGETMSAIDYIKSNSGREEAFNKIQKVLDEYDVIITPTTCVTPFSVENWGPETINGKEINPINGWLPTYVINLTGHPTITIPIGLSKNGLPIGLQIIGNHLDDLIVLQIARAYERGFSWSSYYDNILID